MARIIVMADPEQRDEPLNEAPVLLDERVDPIHLSNEHAAEQLIERLGWAVTDAQDLARSGARATR